MRRLGKGKLKLVIPIIIVVIIVGIIILTNINVLNKLRANVFESSDVKETKESTCDVESISDSYIKITGTIDQDYGEDGLATITFTDGNKSFTKELEVKTNSKTKLDFTLSKGEYNLSVSKEGYDVYEGKINTSQELNITLHNKNIGDVVATGQVGDNVYYNYYSNGLLQLKGTGPTWSNSTDSDGYISSTNYYNGAVLNDILIKNIEKHTKLDKSKKEFLFGNQIYSIIGRNQELFSMVISSKEGLENGTCPDENNENCDILSILLNFFDINESKIIINALADIPAMSNLTINNGITTIGTGILSNIKVNELIIPNSVIYYAEGALRDSQIKNLVLSNNATYLPSHFATGSVIENLNIPNTIKEISSDWTFTSSEIGSLVIPKSVKKISSYSFASAKIENFTFNNFIGSFNINIGTTSNPVEINNLILKEGDKFSTSIISGTVNNLIFRDTFKGEVTNSSCKTRTKIEKVSLGKNTNLPKHGYGVAFNNCSVGYVEVNQENADGYSLFLNKLNNNNKNVEVVFKDGVKTISNFNKDLYSKVTFPDTLRKIEEGAFKNAIITEVTIPSSVMVIGDNAFNKYKLESVTIAGNETRFNTRWTTIGFPENLMP